MFGDADRTASQLANLLGGILRALRQFAYLGRHGGKTLAVFAGAGRFNGGVDGQQVGLVGDVIDDGDARGDLLHGVNHLAHRLAAFGGTAGRLGGDVLGDLGIVGILADGGRHLLD